MGTTMTDDPKPTRSDPDFAKEAEHANAGLIREFWELLINNKKWWLIPIVLVLLIIGLLVILGSSAAAPFIYPLF